MKPQNVLTLLMGRFFENLYRMPGKGEALVRGLTWGLAKIFVRTPYTGLRRSSSVEESIRLLNTICRRCAIDVEVVEKKDDGFEFEVLSCPYGFKRPEQQGVCDAAMDLDRVMFREYGVDLTILDTIAAGAPRCRISMRQQ